MADTSKKRLDYIRNSWVPMVSGALVDLIAMIEERDEIIKQKDKELSERLDELKLYTEDGPWRHGKAFK
jgi:hypothetical protein